MKIQTWKSNAISAKDKWRHQYYDYYRNGEWLDSEKSRIYDELLALNDPTKEQVDKIVGNESWTSCECYECEEDIGMRVQVGSKPDYDSSTIWICPNCLQKALDLCRINK